MPHQSDAVISWQIINLLGIRAVLNYRASWVWKGQATRGAGFGGRGDVPTNTSGHKSSKLNIFSAANRWCSGPFANGGPRTRDRPGADGEDGVAVGRKHDSDSPPQPHLSFPRLHLRTSKF